MTPLTIMTQIWILIKKPTFTEFVLQKVFVSMTNLLMLAASELYTENQDSRQHSIIYNPSQ